MGEASRALSFVVRKRSARKEKRALFRSHLVPTSYERLNSGARLAVPLPAGPTVSERGSADGLKDVP